jgi:arabinose-5-phosphate isomerase
MEKSKAIDIARAVIRAEAEALTCLSEIIDTNFIKVVDMFSSVQGRIIVTGVGKSSHIGKKIASTFSSTGTPAFFLHPSEASHGDLGMIQAGDIVLALSRSGDSEELSIVTDYCKKKEIRVVAITANTNSTLGQASDIRLCIPDIPEACVNRLAPTTSSIMILAIGDALAVACQAKKHFSKEDFKILHPSGKLGRSLTKVSEVMHSRERIPLIRESAPLSDAIVEMTRCRFGCVGVVNEELKLIGIFTDGDLRRNIEKANLSSPMSDLMTRSPESISPETLVNDVMDIFKKKRIPSVFVCKDDSPLGILHMHDLLQLGFI